MRTYLPDFSTASTLAQSDLPRDPVLFFGGQSPQAL